MRIVIDTNILVSALLTPGGNPDRILALVLNGKLVSLFDTSILTEYRVVLARPKFGFDRDRVAAILDYISSEGQLVSAEPCSVHFADPEDRKFYEVAISGRAEALITGNTIHFPKMPLVQKPSEFLAMWGVA